VTQSVDFPVIRTAGGIVPNLPGSFPNLLQQNADEIRENRNDATDAFDHLPIPDRQPVSDPTGDGSGGGLPTAKILLGLAVVAVFSYGTGQLFTFEVGS